MLTAIQLIRREDQWLPEHRLIAIETARGQNPDDAVRFTVERQVPIENAGIAPELPLPERVAQHHHRRSARLIFTRCERAPDLGLHAKHFEVVGRHQLARKARRIAASCHRGSGRLLYRQRLEDIVLPFPVEKGKCGGPVAPHRRGFPQPDHALRLGERKRFQQDRINDTEHCRVGADAKSQQPDGDRGESGIARQRGHAVSQVSQQVLHPADAPLIAMLFLHRFDSSKTPASLAAGLFWR